MARFIRKSTLRPQATVGAVFALVVLAGCGASGDAAGGSASGGGSSSTSMSTSSITPSSGGASSGSSTPQASSTIHISSFKFKVPDSVAPGATVSVMNMDSENHTVTADAGGAFDVKATAGTTTTFVAPTKPGSYPFHCIYHANMHGVLVVK